MAVRNPVRPAAEEKQAAGTAPLVPEGGVHDSSAAGAPFRFTYSSVNATGLPASSSTVASSVGVNHFVFQESRTGCLSISNRKPSFAYTWKVYRPVLGGCNVPCQRTLKPRPMVSAGGRRRSRTVTEVAPSIPEAATQGSSPETAEACRVKNAGEPAALTGTFGDGQPPLGYPTHSVPLSASRSPGAPKLTPTRRTSGRSLPASPKSSKVHFSTSGVGTSASEV